MMFPLLHKASSFHRIFKKNTAILKDYYNLLIYQIHMILRPDINKLSVISIEWLNMSFFFFWS